MSNDLFPTLGGLQWNRVKQPEFNTVTMTAVDLSELRSSFSDTPIYNVVQSYDVLRDDVAHNELETLMGFFLKHRGSWDSWLFNDPDDFAVINEAFGEGDAAETEYQLRRTFGAFTEKVSNLNASPAISINGVLQSTGYTVSATGLVTFDTAPADGALITWTGTYYFRCRFTEDMQTFNQFMQHLWENKQVEFRCSLGTKI